MNSKQFNIAVLLTTIIGIALITGLLSSCSSNKENNKISLSKDKDSDKIKDPSIILRATNLENGSIQALVLPDSVYNVYLKGDTIWAINNIIRPFLVIPEKGENFKEETRVGNYIKYRIEE
jgi:hypothetical protein